MYYNATTPPSDEFSKGDIQSDSLLVFLFEFECTRVDGESGKDKKKLSKHFSSVFSNAAKVA